MAQSLKKRSEVDYYEVLGVEKTAESKEIRQAYKTLAMQYHPDRNPSTEAEEKFKLINEAHETLSDPKARQRYDYGPQGDEEYFAPPPVVIPPWKLRKRWMYHFGGWIFTLLFDYLFGVSCLWIASVLILLYLLFASNFSTFFKTQVVLVKVVIDVILYFSLPTVWAARLANIIIYTLAISIQNMPTIQIDASIGVWLLMVLNDVYVRNEPLAWSYLAVNSITVYLIISFFLGLYFVSFYKMIPVSHSYIGTIYEKYYDMKSIPFISLFLFVPLYFLKFVIFGNKIPIDWLPVPLFVVALLFDSLLSGKMNKFITMSSVLILPALVSYMLIPKELLPYLISSVHYLGVLGIIGFSDVSSKLHPKNTDSSLAPHITFKQLYDNIHKSYFILYVLYLLGDIFVLGHTCKKEYSGWFPFLGSISCCFILFSILSYFFHIHSIIPTPLLGNLTSLFHKLWTLIFPPKTEEKLDPRRQKKQMKKKENKAKKQKM